MASTSPNLPTKFPCWCRAVYSWGGETDKDLGFIEGDLIECLNAGDGSWWMGRLRRDRRMLGLFPSNFVVVLGDGFTPVSRSVSPLPSSLQNGGGSKNSAANLQARKEKAKSRRPFQGYKTAVGPGGVTPASTPPQSSPAVTPRKKKPVYDVVNSPSTVLWQQGSHQRGQSRSPSPMPEHETGSSPPPPPPPHRVALNGGSFLQRFPSPQPLDHQDSSFDGNCFVRRYSSPQPPSHQIELCREDFSRRSPSPQPPHHQVAMNGGNLLRREPSPQPPQHQAHDYFQVISRTPSPGIASLNGHTPPMLRDAMDDIMSSLEDMGVSRRESEQEAGTPFNPWSPEAFDEIARPVNRPTARPLTSLGLGAGGSSYSETARQSYSSRHNSPDRYHDGPPQLETYVQRMESRLRKAQEAKQITNGDTLGSDPPEPPPKNSPWNSRPVSVMGMAARTLSIRNRKSMHDLGRSREALARTYTTKTNSTNSSSGAQSSATHSSGQTSMTSQSVMSGPSASGFSATSAGSLWRSRNKIGSIRGGDTGRPMTSAGTRGEQAQFLRSQTPLTGISYHSSQESHVQPQLRAGAPSTVGWEESSRPSSSAGLGGFAMPKVSSPKKSGFFKKLIDSAKTGAASARSTVAPGQAGMGPESPPKRNGFNNGVTGIAGGMALSPSPQKEMSNANGYFGKDAAREMGLGGGGSGSGSDWVSMRRDVNRSNTPGPSERQERANRCLMLDHPVIYAVDELYETAEGDEGADGRPVTEPFQLSNPSFSLVDKAARFITSLPVTITASALASGYVCRPHRSDVQRLRAMFTWCAERIAWDEEFEGEIDLRRVIQSKRGCSREVAVLVVEMCSAIGIHAEIVGGHLKTPGEDLNLDVLVRGADHWWNAILVDGEWRMLDASLAGPTNPKRGLYSGVSANIAEAWYFLARPSEFAWTHVPVDEAQQKMVPAVSPDVLLALPVSLPPFFRMGLGLHNYDTSLIRLDGLEVCTLSINVPLDVEVVAEVEATSYLTDQDGDVYENADVVTKKRALSQASWYAPSGNPNGLQKRYIVKALLPGDERLGLLKVYAGKKGLMHSSKDIVHPLAMALPLYHQGENPQYEFLTRHPTPHAMRQDLYVVQPQCRRLCFGESFIFAVRQHATSVVSTPQVEQSGFDFRPLSPNPMNRPTSAMSMTSSATGSNGSEQGSNVLGGGLKAKDKPAKLAVQSPGGKIIRLSRKAEHTISPSPNKDLDGEVQGSVWETVVKVQERGLWRGLVLADRSARWCVWGEWECV